MTKSCRPLCKSKDLSALQQSSTLPKHKGSSTMSRVPMGKGLVTTRPCPFEGISVSFREGWRKSLREKGVRLGEGVVIYFFSVGLFACLL